MTRSALLASLVLLALLASPAAAQSATAVFDAPTRAAVDPAPAPSTATPSSTPTSSSSSGPSSPSSSSSSSRSSGIVGLVQMQPGNWAIFALPGGNPFDPHDALFAAARFLCAHGAAQDLRGALFAYNHLDSYVADVLQWAQVYAGVLGPELGGTGERTTPTTGSRAAAGVEIVRVAETWRGVPYVWGGASRAGVDCSGLVLQVFAQFGVRLPHNAQLQYNAVPHIGTDELQPGDLVFFAATVPSTTDWITHVGIYVGNGQQLNAPTTGQVVSVQPVFTGFWGAHLAGAGRVPVPSRPAACASCV